MNHPDPSRGPVAPPPHAPAQQHPGQQYPVQRYPVQQYPVQQYPGPHGRPGSGEPQPWTRPGWGLVPVVLGTLVALVGALALPWVEQESMYGWSVLIGRAVEEGVLSDKWGHHVFQAYFQWAGLGLIALHAVYYLAWTAGGVRGKKSAKLILSTSGRSVERGRLGPMRAMMAVASLLLTVGHAIATYRGVFEDFDALSSGVYVTLGGLVLITVGGAIGPRLGTPTGRPQS
ncbi:hypothetical protein [Prauserella cavernicola]|uniref:Uncharacterized protein n=1 Tax=Prauserella cavernicola TaxID=2800127 RepID=A0A934QNN6_9PSEU|nr:hypothetical protein [Prauserella cavernicola]MBK1783241.1 hypothetical protein [Prauserella cavernicola]